MSLPECGIYRTTVDIAGISAGRLVYFHNHGDPGPGLYLPASWHLNRATFSERGSTLTEPDLARTLKALPLEGLYRVRDAFTCCEKKCRTFAEDTLVQLGYNGEGRAIVFEPEWRNEGIGIPGTGQAVDDSCLASLVLLKLQRAAAAESAAPEHLH